MNNDTRISEHDLKVLRHRMDKSGWTKAALALFDKEPVLAQHMADEFEAVRQRLRKAGLSADQVETLLPLLARLALEPVLLVDRAHRQLWDDFLPTEQLATKFVIPTASGETERRTFARVDWDPKHVQALRPDLTEFQAQVFLEFREVEIGSVMRDAGWAAMERMLKDYLPRGGTS